MYIEAPFKYLTKGSALFVIVFGYERVYLCILVKYLSRCSDIF